VDGLTQSLSIFELSGRRKVLGGAIPGRAMLAKLITTVQPPSEPEAVLLDFRGIDFATSSFLREAVLGLRDYCTKTQANLYPVVANACDVILDELDFLLRSKGDAVVVCKVDRRGNVTSPSIVGELHEKQRLTFEAVVSAREADAAFLEKQFGRSEQIHITGWNNRLSALVAKGVLMEVKKGRSKVYRPVVG
jgi:hypothetical protein